MTLANRNRTNSDIDDRTERECVARGKVAARNRGIIPLRWVDVMPVVVTRDLLAEVRAARANLSRDMGGAAAAQTAAVSRWALTPEKRARYNELKRARYAGSSEALKAENERRKAALRTPQQQKQHDDYIARKAKRKVES